MGSLSAEDQAKLIEAIKRDEAAKTAGGLTPLDFADRPGDILAFSTAEETIATAMTKLSSDCPCHLEYLPINPTSVAQEWIRYVYLPKSIDGKAVLIESGDSHWLVDNSLFDAEALKALSKNDGCGGYAPASGLCYRLTKSLSGYPVRGVSGPTWGSTVQGLDEGEWVKVDSIKAGCCMFEPNRCSSQAVDGGTNYFVQVRISRNQACQVPGKSIHLRIFKPDSGEPMTLAGIKCGVTMDNPLTLF